jgi:membrane fusion protein (multidrug efflux system)
MLETQYATNRSAFFNQNQACQDDRHDGQVNSLVLTTGNPWSGNTRLEWAQSPEKKPMKPSLASTNDTVINELGAIPGKPDDIAPGESGSEPQRSALRPVLLVSGPLLLALVGGWFWLTSGRFVGTEDAYVKADKVILGAEVAGSIAAITVRENQHVEAGSELLRIDDRHYRIALAKAEAELAAVTSDIESIKASLKQKNEELTLARTNATFAEREFQRQSQLATRKLNSQAQLDEARHKLDVARQQISVVEQERAQYLSRLSGNPDLPVKQHPDYLQAKATLDAAALDVERTIVRAPFAGIASRVPQVGQYVAAGNPLMGLVADSEMWIEANFMETDLTNVRPGQPATVRIDSYPGHEWTGHVLSISQATGAEFSVLPPQNASGNWVKIVQRIPVRIAIDARKDDPQLRLGMTATVEIDTKPPAPQTDEKAAAVNR